MALTPATSAQGVIAVGSAPSVSIASRTMFICSNSSSRMCWSTGIRSESAVPNALALAIIASYRRTPLRSKARRSPSLSMRISGLLPRAMSKVVLSMPLADPGTGTEPIRSASSVRLTRSSMAPLSLPATSGRICSTASSRLLVSLGDIWTPVMLAPTLAAVAISKTSSGMLAHEFATRRPLVARRDDVRGEPLRGKVVAIVEGGLRLLGLVDIGRTGGAQVDFGGQHLANELTLALELDHFRQRAGEDFRRVTPFDLLEPFASHVQVAQLVVEEAFPDRLDTRVGLLLGAAGVHVDLHRLMHQPLLDMAFAGVLQRAVLSHVLLFHRSDLGIQLPRHRVGEQRADVHVVIVGLVFRAGDQRCVDLGDQRSVVLLVVVADVVFRVTMVLGRLATGNDVGVALQDIVGILAFQAIEHGRV